MTYAPSMFTGGPGGATAWADVTGKPSVFTPDTHGQAISTVTGLQTALDGKQASGSYASASHDHAGVYAPVASVPNASYRSLLDTTSSHIAARVAGTYWFGQGQPAGITGTGTLYAPNLLYIDSADYPTLNGVAPKLRIRAQVYVNDVAPTGNFTLGLYPVTRPATSGGAGLNIYTMGAVVTGSAPTTLTTPAADSMNIIVGSDFALPANGHYVLGMVTTATVAASSHLHISAILQMRNA